MLDYIKFSFRILSKNRLYALISVFGLAVGISCCILISMFVSHELSYDNFHKDKKNIFRLTTVGNGFTSGLTSIGIGPTLYNENDDINSFCRYMNLGNLVDFKKDSIQFNEQQIIVADSNFFNFFGFNLIKGDKKTVLSKPYSIVLSESIAKKYFRTNDPINDSIYLDKKAYLVTGIVEDNPGNSDIQYNGITSISSMNQSSKETYYKDWFRVICFTYVKFNNVPTLTEIQNKLDEFSDKYVKPWGLENDTKQVDYYRAQPIEKVHFNNLNEFDSPKGNINYIYIFSCIAIFVLLIACINYVNLTLSQTTNRAKEIGIRKTLGSDATDIKIQFFIETFIITIIGFSISLVFIEILIPTFNNLALKSLNFKSLLTLNSIIYSLIFIAIITLFSGFYPSYILSSFNPIEVLKGQKGKRNSIGLTRKFLITIQFIFSIGMIISSIVVYQQMDYMKTKNLGFNKDQILIFRIPNDTVFEKRLQYIQDEFIEYTSLKKVAFSSTIPGEGLGDLMFRVELDSKMKDAQLKLMSCDENYIDLLGIKIIEGDNFINNNSNDQKKTFIINKAAADKFDWKENAIGKRMQWGLLPNGKAEHDGFVIGVVENFHTHSLHSEIPPMVIQYVNRKNYLSVKINKANANNEISKLKDIWNNELGDRITETFFLDENFNKQYQAEERMLSVFNYFTILSIILSTLGLFALTSFMIKQKTKEIGIRKILGASTKNIIYIISRDFLQLMLIGFVLASFPTYYFINKWLEGFAYHIETGVLPFAIAIFTTFLVIMFVVIYNTIKTTNFNPIDALKSE